MESDKVPIIENTDESDKGFVKIRHKHAISDTEALIHLIKMNVGIGVMALPSAFYNSGMLVGIIAMAVIGVITVHCMHLLVFVGQTMTKRLDAEFLDYAEVVDLTLASTERTKRFRKAAKITINIFLCTAQIGGFAVYILFIAKNFQTVFHGIYGWNLDYRIYLAFILPPTVFICSLRNLRILTPVSIMATIFEFYTIGVIFYYLFRDPLPSFRDRPLFSSWDKLPIFLGTALFTFEGIGIVLPLENKMKDPGGMPGWTGVLNTGMVLVACLYVAVGFFGYLRYGDAVDGNNSGSITLNLPEDELLANSARVVISLAILFSNPLQFYVAVSIIFPEVMAPRIPRKRHVLAEYLLRYSIIIFCFALAALVPDLDLFISLSGAICMATLSLITPAGLDMVVRHPDCPIWIKVKNWSIIIFGVAVSIFGTVLSFQDLIQRHTQ